MKSSKRSAVTQSAPAETKWLERTLIAGPHLALCCTEAEYTAALDHLKIPVDQREKWLRKGGMTHTFEKSGESITCVVCVDLKDIKKRPISEVANILVHEAVHVWQQHCDDIGEHSPSREFEAYSIQALFAQLFWEAEKRRRRG